MQKVKTLNQLMDFIKKSQIFDYTKPVTSTMAAQNAMVAQIKAKGYITEQNFEKVSQVFMDLEALYSDCISQFMQCIQVIDTIPQEKGM